jgi:hypothetical protein
MTISDTAVSAIPTGDASGALFVSSERGSTVE